MTEKEYDEYDFAFFVVEKPGYKYLCRLDSVMKVHRQSI